MYVMNMLSILLKVPRLFVLYAMKFFDANHAMCLIDHVISMNVRAKSASKKNKKRKEWKPTGKVFNSVGYKWKPTGRTFTLVANACTLTRITTTNKVPLRVPIPLEVVAPKHVVTRVYTRRPKVPKSIQNSKPKVVKSMTANRMEPCTSWGSDTLVAPSSSSLIDCRDMMAYSPICLLSKATKTKSWLWHRRLSHLNFGAINHLSRHGLVRGLSRLKFKKEHLCSACAMGKSKKQSHKPISEDLNQEKLYLLHMDLYEPTSVASVNGKKYIFVIMDDYSRFTWVKFLASKDEGPDFIIKFLKMIQVRLNATVRNIRTDKRTEFVNQTLWDYYEQVGISHETSVARTSQQNGVVEWRNRTLVEAAHTIENLGKLQPKTDIGIFIGYAPKKKAYRIYNRRTQKIIKAIHVDFDELTAMASKQLGSGPRLQCMTPATPSSGLIPNTPPSAPFIPPSRHEFDLMFQPVFDEFFSPPASVASLVPIEETLDPAESIGLPSSTTVDQDAPLLMADALSRKSGMIAGIKVDEEIIHDLERLDIKLYVRGQHGYWASLRIEPDLISRVKEAQKEDNEIWTIVENLNEQTEFRLDEDDVLWQEIHVSRLIFGKVKIEHQRASGLLQPLDIPVWKWDEISMDFVTGLPQTQRRHDAIWVVVDRLTKSAHFLPIRKDYSVSKLAETFQQEIVRLHGTPSAIVSDRDPRFASHFWKGLQKAWRTRLKKCHAPICWDQVREHVIEGLEMIEVTNEKVADAKEKLKEARTLVACSQRISCLFAQRVQVSSSSCHFISLLDQIRADLSYVEEPEAILDRQDRVMRNKTIPFVKILWRNHPEREATWETEESIRTSFPNFLP
nr:integrase, catalytic region, zinc finger, CCHC-type, peptidase aspartic, catalytic [Tanacetum cinerariifolium]